MEKFRRIERLFYFQDWFLHLWQQTGNFEYRKLAGRCKSKLWALGVDAPIFTQMTEYHEQI